MVDGEGFENFAGAGDDGGGDPGEAGDLHAVGLIGASREDAVEEDELGVGVAGRPFADGDVEVFDLAGEAIFELGDLVVVGREEGAGVGGSDGVTE